VEFALIAPLLILLLLAVLAGGLYFMASAQQATATATLARYVADHADPDPDEFYAFTTAVVPCVGGATITVDGHLVTVVISCPGIAGELLPMFPTTVTTSATAYMPGPSASPEPTEVPTPEP
jgi:Flp pilus assembly protein TadG